MNDIYNRSNPSKRGPIFSRPTDEECDVEVDEILDLLAALMRKHNRVKVNDQSEDPADGREKPSADSQN